ncbi:VP80 [Alphabaculovirus myunipunctae]|uniref:VP80 n=1 Tax=Mythimna unipuncta nucleopolyhedrovirus TaxID=447897 RepID=A0A2K9VS96_9ABAC|nr:VP80 [Mythimna unipuncta nucleopolyhedrovirus]AUV65338.1 VP80 [Mythimna unipuncta nucleopolyhedrovirus]
MTTISEIRENSAKLSRNYALLLRNYLIHTQRERFDEIQGVFADIEDVVVAGGTAEQQIRIQSQKIKQLQGMLSNYARPSTSINSSNNNNNDGNGDDNDENMHKLMALLKELLSKNTLQTVTMDTLRAFNDRIVDPSHIYTDDLQERLLFDSIDCEYDSTLQRFIRLYNVYSDAQCVVVDVEYYADLIKKDARLIDTLPPTVRSAVVSIVDLVERKQEYTLTLHIDPKEFGSVEDKNVKMLLSKYMAHRPIVFKSSVAAVSDMSTDEESPTPSPIAATAATTMTTTQSIRRKLRKRPTILPSPPPPQSESDTSPSSSEPEVVRSKRERIQSPIGVVEEPASPRGPMLTTIASAQSNEAFINHLSQMHRPTSKIPNLLTYIMRIVPIDVTESLLTCPTNALNANRINVANYRTAVDKINRMNLAPINKSVHFYELLEPLAHYHADEASVSKMLYFITGCSRYLTANAQNFTVLRRSLQAVGSNDPDRVALFMIRYNFLYFYREFIGQIVGLPVSPFQSQKLVNYIYVHDSVVQQEYDKIVYRFNANRVYVGPVDDVVKLMAVSLADTLP